MAAHDWYRNTTWNQCIEDSYFAKLKRARAGHDQYLVIQALHLAENEPAITLKLIDLYFEKRIDKFHDAQAFCARAEAYKRQKKTKLAIQSYKDALAREAEFPSHKTSAYLELPYLVACEKISDEYDFVLSLLEDEKDNLPFPISQYLWHASKALIDHDQNFEVDAIQHARKAISAAKIKKSTFKYHQEVGLVGKTHNSVFKQLINLVR